LSSLTELADKYGTDRGSIRHGYTDLYEPLFQEYRSTRGQLLEIGVVENDKNPEQTGAGIKMWLSWFHDLMYVHGLDVQASPFGENEVVDYTHWVGDQGDPPILCELRKTLDKLCIVVDDGSHRTQDQLMSLALLWPQVKSGGYYAIEDLASKKDDGAYESTQQILDTWPEVTSDMLPNAVCEQWSGTIQDIHWYHRERTNSHLAVLEKA